MESWTEVNVVPTRPLDSALLTDVVHPLVHDVFADDLETWFFFWEPELRLRLRWRAEHHGADLAAGLDAAVASGRVLEWWEGAHGRPGERYEGEAEMYGPEIWGHVQKDWMNGSELALAIKLLARDGRLSETPRFHWSRHTHLFTNQLFGTWDDEVELCLSQALGYLRHIVAGGSAPTPETARLVAELAAILDLH
jgi:hypothetical protein